MGELVYQEFADCSVNDGCPSPTTCVKDPVLGNLGCEFPCLTNADCPNPQTTCVATTDALGNPTQACAINSCDPATPGALNPAPVPNSACNVASAAAGDGTCLPLQIDAISHQTGPAWACVSPGTASTNFGSCFWPGAHSTPATTCPQNQICNTSMALQVQIDVPTRKQGNEIYSNNVPIDLPLGQCEPLCTPDAGPESCDSGVCVTLAAGANPGAPYTSGSGACLIQNTDAGCFVGLGSTEYNDCATNADCQCPQTCTNLDLNYPPICEAPCTVDTDCPSAGDYCNLGLCQQRFCQTNTGSLNDGGGVSPGTIYGDCTVDGGDDGYCLPSWINNDFETGAVGICYLKGTATTSCDSTYAWDTSTLCGAGQVCLFGTCQTVCDPKLLTPPACNGGTSCITLDSNWFSPPINPIDVPVQIEPLGICLGACWPTGTFCVNDGDCCSGTCSNGGAAAVEGTCL